MKTTPRGSSRTYSRLLWLLRGRNPQEQAAIKDDAELLLDSARTRGRGALVATWLALVWDLVLAGAAQDLRRAVRSLMRAPGFAVTTSLLLGLEIGRAHV